MRTLIDKLERERNLTDEEFRMLIEDYSNDEYLHNRADAVRQQYYGKDVYIRGLIEVSNYCKNDCLYCGIRRSNLNCHRYRLTKEQILDCADTGYKLGFRTFVLQGGEDNHFTDDFVCDVVRTIKSKYPDCAVTLSLGERSRESYQKLYDAGADRYLLRHETATSEHYSQLHPEGMTFETRRQCLLSLKEIGFQFGAGFMVGSPGQTTDNLIADLRFLQELQPDMIGIGPFLHHHDTPFKDEPDGSVELSLKMLSILRLMFPYALLPSTTALGTKDPHGREKGILAGGNVVMPNLSPVDVRKLYTLYDNKICTDEESAQSKAMLEKQMESIGYHIVTARGDVKSH